MSFYAFFWFCFTVRISGYNYLCFCLIYKNLYLLLFKLLLHRRYHIEVTPERSKCKRHLTLSFCNKPMNQKYQIIKTNGCWNDRYIQVFVGVVHRRRDVKMGYDRGTRAGPSDVFLFILILQPEKERFEVSQERCHA